jgi:hypothetical protein
VQRLLLLRVHAGGPSARQLCRREEVDG